MSLSHNSCKMEVPKTDLQTFIKYLEDAAKLYDALALLPMQKCTCRSHMIKKLTNKYKQKLQDYDKSRHR